MRELNKIIIHCTDSGWGDLEDVDRWHRQRGWDGIGYHFLVLNQFPTYKSFKDREGDSLMDGKVRLGRPVETVGAHCEGYNYYSLGICLVGTIMFTKAQFYTLWYLLDALCDKYKIPMDWEHILGHSQLDPMKSCPNFDVEQFVKNQIIEKYKPEFLNKKREI